MKTSAILGVALSILWTGPALAQSIAPAKLEWRKSFNRGSAEREPFFLRTSDGGFVLGGHAYSGFGSGEYDYWLIRLDGQHHEVWDAMFGGNDVDFARAAVQTSDGGFLLVGDSRSFESTGNKSAPLLGHDDIWVVRLDASGSKLWDKSYGGIYGDQARAVIRTSDGGFLIAGSSQSPTNAQKTAVTFGYSDFWVIRITEDGERLWDRSFGGESEDQLSDAMQTADGGFLLVGHSLSLPGANKTSPNYGGSDYWLVRIDSTGDLLWDKTCGGTGNDEAPRAFQTSDGGFVIAGRSDSPISGNKTTPRYGDQWQDYWIVRLDSQGNKLWEHTFGGSGMEHCDDVIQTIDGGFVVAGASNSETDGNKTAPRLASMDLWLVRLDAMGRRIWDQTYTHSNYMGHARLLTTPEGGMLVASSAVGDGTDPGTADLSLIKLSADALSAVAPSTIQWSKKYAASGDDRVVSLEQMPDNGFILGCASSSSISGDKSALHFGDFDFWVLRLNAVGEKIWEASFGGEAGDEIRDTHPTPNGGVILVGGSASSPSGNKTAPLLGESDFWVVLLDGDGNKVWDRSFGGTLRDRAEAVEYTSDGGFLVGGTSYSSTNSADFLVVRLNASGDKLWERTFGSRWPDHLSDLRQTADAGFVLAGESDGDFWIVRIDANGNKLWDRTFGGTGYDGECRVRVLSDGGFILAGVTLSDVSGNKSTPLQGDYDYWLLRLDAEGNKVWEHDFGGTHIDYFSDVHVTLDGGFIAAGFSSSEADGNKTAPRRGDSYDAWLVRLDQSGKRIWDQSYDGIHRFGPARIQPTRDGGLMMAASFATYTNMPIQDLILYKLSADALTAPKLALPAVLAGDVFRFHLSGISNRTYVTEFSSDLLSWSPFATNQLLSGSVDVTDSAPAAGRRFYRARLVE